MATRSLTDSIKIVMESAGRIVANLEPRTCLWHEGHFLLEELDLILDQAEVVESQVKK